MECGKTKKASNDKYVRSSPWRTMDTAVLFLAINTVKPLSASFQSLLCVHQKDSSSYNHSGTIWEEEEGAIEMKVKWLVF